MQAIKNFRTYFLRGLGALLPTILTIWIFVQCYLFFENRISIYMNRAVVWLILKVSDRWDEAFLEAFWVDGSGKITGFFIAIVLVVFIGAFLASVMGRTLWRFFENTFMNLPLVKKVYPHIKQITDFFLTKQNLAFNDVVAVQYPRAGIWSIGLVTGTGLRSVADRTQKEYLTVFIPTSPTPFTGFVIMAPKEETIVLDISIEEALRFTISGGVITPAKHQAFKALANKPQVEHV